MTSDANDATTSEPLLSSQRIDEDEEVDAFDNTSLSKSRGTSLFHSKYVLGCALFSSIGGLIFGYGTCIGYSC